MNEPSFTLFNSDTGTKVLLWAITILVAGFIAQFGKKFATYLIEKIKSVKSRRSSPRAVQPTAPDHPYPVQDPAALTGAMAVPDARKAEMKLNKKMMKALAKEKKKK